MHLIIEDTVPDPFLGTGTTTASAIVCGRSSIGYEIEAGLTASIHESIMGAVEREGNDLNKRRLNDHSISGYRLVWEK